jgi:predicted proteasome-type protease
VLISFDSTVCGKIAVGMPTELICIKRDSRANDGAPTLPRRDFYLSALVKILARWYPDPLFNLLQMFR